MNMLTKQGNGNRVYAWIIATCTLMMLGLFAWPLSVSQFETASLFGLKYEPTSGIEKSLLNEWLVDALQKETSRASIAEIYTQIKANVESEVLNSLDPGQIRGSIKIQGRPGDSANQVDYRLSMLGQGTSDEIEFVNIIVSRIHNQLKQRVARQANNQVIEDMLAGWQEVHRGQMQNVASQIEGLLGTLNTTENDIRIAMGDLQDLGNRFKNPEFGTGAVLGRPAPEILKALNEEKRRLLSQGVNPYHPTVTRIQDKIERMTTLPQIRVSSVPSDAEQQGSNSRGSNNRDSSVSLASDVKRVTNPYVNTSSSVNASSSGSSSDGLNLDGLTLDVETDLPTNFASVTNVIKSFELIDLSPTRQAIIELQGTLQQLQSTETLLDRLGENALVELQSAMPVSLSNLEKAKSSSPVGGAPGIGQFIMLLFAAGLFGTVVTFNLDPTLKRTPFRSVEQLQRKLNMPVIGVLRDQSPERPRPFNKLAANKVLQVCEWTLLALAVLLILAALANSDVAAAFIENPFHGITQTFWLVTPGR